MMLVEEFLKLLDEKIAEQDVKIFWMFSKAEIFELNRRELLALLNENDPKAEVQAVLQDRLDDVAGRADLARYLAERKEAGAA
jgi:hypothetical protein